MMSDSGINWVGIGELSDTWNQLVGYWGNERYVELTGMILGC